MHRHPSPSLEFPIEPLRYSSVVDINDENKQWSPVKVVLYSKMYVETNGVKALEDEFNKWSSRFIDDIDDKTLMPFLLDWHPLSREVILLLLTVDFIYLASIDTVSALKI